MSNSKNASDQSIQELYTALIKTDNPQELLPFLTTYGHANKTALRQAVKKARKYWLDFFDLTNDPDYPPVLSSGWRRRATTEQGEIIILSAIALLDETEIMRWEEAIPYFERLDNPLVWAVIDWARPAWINTFLLTQIRRQEWRSIDYFSLRKLEDHQLVEYDPELFVLCLAGYSSWINAPKPQLAYIQRVTDDPVAYQRDVPLLFEYETSIQNKVFPSKPKSQDRDTAIWERVFTKLLADGKMDRGWFIEQCILVQTKEWNGNLRSFFRKRLEEASPSDVELLAVQNPIFACLNAPANMVVNFAVDLIRKIWHLDGFDFQSFLEFVEPVMMRTDCKGSIRHVLTIFDKATAQKPAYRGTMSLLAADTFVVPDLTLQERALQTLKKIGDETDAALSEKLLMYVPQMQGNMADMLGSFLHNTPTEETVLFENYLVETRHYTLLHEGARVPRFIDWNDLLFHFGKLMQSWDVIDAERLLDAFVTQRQLFPDNASEQLKTYADQLSRLYFPAAYRQWISQAIIHIINGDEGIYIPEPSSMQRSNVGNLTKGLVVKIQQKIASGSTRPLLCYPTHLPYWIDPSVLIDRLIAYDEANEAIDPADFAIAISRTRRENVAEAAQKLHQLPERYQPLMAFIIGTTDEILLPEKTSVREKLVRTGASVDYIPWAVAARTFHPDRVFPEFEQTDLKDAVNVVSPFEPTVVVDVQKLTSQNPYTKKTEAHTMRQLIATLPALTWTEKPGLLYSMDIYEYKDRYWGQSLSLGGILYWHSVMPQNDQALASYLLRYCCEYAEGEGHEDLRGFLHITTHPGFRFTETAYFVVACACLYKDATLRNYTAETLRLLVSARRIDIMNLGEKLAHLISSGYAPLQRFIDVTAMIRDDSALHNGALRMLFDTILERFQPADKLPTGFKKLLEAYYDLLTKTQQPPSEPALQNLAQLPQSASLKPILKQLQSIAQK